MGDQILQDSISLFSYLEKRILEQGIEQGKTEIILQMLRKGMEKALIREIAGVDEETIDRLHKEDRM